MEDGNKAFLSAKQLYDIPLYKLNNEHNKNHFAYGHNLPSEAVCRKTVLQLSLDELQQVRNAAHDKQVFLIVD